MSALSLRTKIFAVIALGAVAAWLLLSVPGGGEPGPVTGAPVTVTVTTTISPSPPASGTQSATPAAPSRTVKATRPSLTTTPQSAAELFVAAWMDTSRGREAWLGGVAPYVVREMIDGLALTDLTQVPSGRVLDSKATYSDGADAQVAVRTTVGTYVVSLHGTGRAWKVWSVEPIQATP